MPNLKPILQKQFLVVIPGLPQMSFTKVSAPKEKREQTDYNDGSTGVVKKVAGFTSYDNVTLSKPYNPVQDKALYTWYQQQLQVGATQFTVSVQPVNADQAGTTVAGGATLILKNCEVVAIKFPDVDRMGNSVAMVELEITYEGFTFQ